MVYLIVVHLSGREEPKWTNFRGKLTAREAVPFVKEYAWLVESDQTAVELYLELSEALDLPSFDTLIVAEITLNTIGSYFAAAEPTARARAIAAVLGKARR